MINLVIINHRGHKKKRAEFKPVRQIIRLSDNVIKRFSYLVSTKQTHRDSLNARSEAFSLKRHTSCTSPLSDGSYRCSYTIDS
jgi:hypothetical protein